VRVQRPRAQLNRSSAVLPGERQEEKDKQTSRPEPLKQGRPTWRPRFHARDLAGWRSMPVRSSRAAHAARVGRTGANRRWLTHAARVCRGEHGQLLLQLCRTAMRTFRSLPSAGADQDFAVLLALLTMKFVNRHGESVTPPPEFSSRKGTLHGPLTRPSRFATSLRVNPDQPRQSLDELPASPTACEFPEATASGEHWRWCPRCGHELHNEKCKLRCPRCHYFMSCSDFD
jgi:hypothetical protein